MRAWPSRTPVTGCGPAQEPLRGLGRAGCCCRGGAMVAMTPC